MTTTMVIICCAVATFVGFGLAYLFKPNNQPTGSDSDQRLAEAKANADALQEKLKRLESLGNNSSQLAEQQGKITSLNQEKADLQKKLSQLESEKRELDKRLQDAMNGNIDASTSDEIKTLKKKISDLEEEKEDLEDDFNDKLKKEKRKLEEQKNQIEDDLRKSKKDLEAANEQVQTLTLDLKDAERSANLKKESLAFVKEVLTAPATSSGDMNKLYNIINDIKDIIVDRLVPWSIRCMQRPDDEDYFYYEAYNWEAISRKKWIANKTAIAFVGEFSAGKTSIVNTLLSQGNSNVTKLPVSAKATTAIPTYITGGNVENFQFISPDNVLKQMRKDTFMKINKEVLDEVDGVSAMLKYFVMEYKNSNLNNLSILDTPGFNSNDSEDAQRTIEVINECDALFWVFDVNAGTVNKSSIKLIKEHLKKPLYVVINKVDTKSNLDVQQVEDLIRRTLSNEGVQVQKFIRFSSSDKVGQQYFNELMSIIKSVPQSNNTSEYLNKVMQWVNSLVEFCNKAYKESAKQCNDSEKYVEELFNGISNLVDNVIRDCEDVSEYGSYKTKWFRDDVYEFSESEFNSLQSKLDTINNSVVTLWNDNFIPYKDAVVKEKDLLDDKSTAQSKLRQITDIQESLKKKIAEFNKLK